MKTIFSLITVLLLASCVQFDFQEADLEEWIFGEPLPNQVTIPDDHDALGDANAHGCPEADGDKTAVLGNTPMAPVDAVSVIYVKIYSGLRFLSGRTDTVRSSQSLIPRRPFLSWTFA